MEYFIFIGGKKVPVDEDVYRALMRPAWAEQRRKRRHAKRGDHFLSMDSMMEDGFDPVSDAPLVDQIVEDKLLLEMLNTALRELTDEERDLINALYYLEKSERAVADEIGVSQNTIHYRKNRVLEKLRQIIERKM